MKLPNFFIVGAAKAATTSIHEYLKQHPEIFMSDFKEPCFFIHKNNSDLNFKSSRKTIFINDLLSYKKLFSDAKSQHKILGESSTPYLLFSETVIENIKKNYDNLNKIKILIVLRNPVHRAFSQYIMRIRDNREDLDFISAIKMEDLRKKENYHFDFFYLQKSKYYDSVKNFLSHFPQTKIMFYDDFKKNSQFFLDEILLFLELKKFNFKKINSKNISGISRYKLITSLLKDDFYIKRIIKKILNRRIISKIRETLLNINIRHKPKITEKEFYFTLKKLNDDIEKLEKLLNINLKHWKSFE